MVDVYIHVPSDHMEQVEDVHLILEHLICTCVRQIIEESEHKVPEIIAAEQWAWRLSQFPLARNGDNDGRAAGPDLEAMFPTEPSLAEEAMGLAGR